MIHESSPLAADLPANKYADDIAHVDVGMSFAIPFSDADIYPRVLADIVHAGFIAGKLLSPIAHPAAEVWEIACYSLAAAEAAQAAQAHAPVPDIEFSENGASRGLSEPSRPMSDPEPPHETAQKGARGQNQAASGIDGDWDGDITNENTAVAFSDDNVSNDWASGGQSYPWEENYAGGGRPEIDNNPEEIRAETVQLIANNWPTWPQEQDLGDEYHSLALKYADRDGDMMDYYQPSLDDAGNVILIANGGQPDMVLTYDHWAGARRAYGMDAPVSESAPDNWAAGTGDVGTKSNNGNSWDAEAAHVGTQDVDAAMIKRARTLAGVIDAWFDQEGVQTQSLRDQGLVPHTWLRQRATKRASFVDSGDAGGTFDELVAVLLAASAMVIEPSIRAKHYKTDGDRVRGWADGAEG